MAAFAAHLREHGLAGLLPLHELLRSASDWRRCEAEPFALPPAAQWGAVVKVLSLLRELRRAGVLADAEVHSAYRGATLNRCAGGAAGSTHFITFAVDLTPRAGAPDPGPALCDFWRTHGPRWQMGLSRYPSGRIHIDTWRHRTWGADHTGRTAFCLAGLAPATP
ncbi:MAG: hypothetical protein KIT17_26465 [Rubrivivax sp.]|nr:hypothetical protein [Rubrivivax sp.]